jgi:hypothetical protein
MQKIIFTIFSVLLFFQTANSQDADTAFYVNTAFKGNERLQYKVAYGLIKGGEATMLINTVPVGDTYLYHIKAVAKTTGVVGAMFTIYDTYESYVDIFSGYPVKSIRNIRENKVYFV